MLNVVIVISSSQNPVIEVYLVYMNKLETGAYEGMRRDATQDSGEN